MTLPSNDLVCARAQPWWRIYCNPMSSLFWGVHLAAVLGIAITGWSWSGFALALGWYGVLMFFVTAGYHRYFAHRSFKTSRLMQLVFGIGATLAAQKGPLWWAAHHRRHHKESDGPADVHSPARTGFLFAHLGWFLCREFKRTDHDRVRDWMRYPELVALDKTGALLPFLLGITLTLLGGWAALSWYLLSIVLIWHGTFTINSLSHVFGGRRYATGDDSRNNPLLAVITHGEGWHNNHHHYQSSCRQGFRWYEWDFTYYLLWAMSRVGLVWDLRAPPQYIVENRAKLGRLGEAPRPAEEALDQAR